MVSRESGNGQQHCAAAVLSGTSRPSFIRVSDKTRGGGGLLWLSGGIMFSLLGGHQEGTVCFLQIKKEN